MTSLTSFKHQLENWSGRLDTLRRLLAKCQETFKQSLGTLIQTYESQIQTLIPILVDLPDDDVSIINTTLLEHAAAERVELEKRRQELRDVLIPQEQAGADACVAESQQQKEKQHQENIALYEKQNELQEKQATLERQLEEMNAEIGAQAKGLGIVQHFFAIRKLRKRRVEIYEQLRRTLDSLHEMRRTWRAATSQLERQEFESQSRWEEVNLNRGRYQAELDILDDPAQFERLAQTQAARTWLDTLRTPVKESPATPGPLQDPVNALVDLNLKNDAYREALGMAAQLNAVCQAVANGLGQMSSTTRKLISQEKQYSQYLPRLDIAIPPDAETFNNQWSPLLEQLKDQEHFAQNPQEFTKIARAVLADGVSNEKIKGMFESLGGAINRATKRWGKK